MTPFPLWKAAPSQSPPPPLGLPASSFLQGRGKNEKEEYGAKRFVDNRHNARTKKKEGAIFFESTEKLSSHIPHAFTWTFLTFGQTMYLCSKALTEWKVCKLYT